MMEKLKSKRALTWLVVLLAFVVLLALASILTSGDKIRGVAPIVVTVIGLIAVFVIYLLTAQNDAWQVETRQVVYMAIGAALYGVFNYIFNTIPMPSVSQVSLRPSVSIPIFFGYVFGPVVGFFTGAVGNILGDFITGWGVYPAWDVGNGLMGLIPGLVMLFGDKKRSLNFLTILVGVLMALAVAVILINPRVVGPWTGEIEDFSLWAWIFLIGGAIVIAGRFLLEQYGVDLAAVNLWGTLGIIIGIGFASLADIWVNGYSFATAIIGEFAPAAGPNIINSMILTPILLAAYNAVQKRAGR
ncbi:MAG TPA: ECF transporter S component [Anaerolineae bacterium]|nr:ECF transporter S component [Anaerolineae bacterium]HQK13911.1 ECF transporter S component [Anaerolineae bacterium]